MFRPLLVVGILLSCHLSFGQQYIISTVSGGVPPTTPVTATTASIGDPPRVAVDSSGNLYFGGLHSVYKVDRSGVLSRIAGNGRSGYAGDGGAATSAQLSYPDGIAINGAGEIFVSDRTSNVIRKIALNGTISTYAGTGTIGSTGDGGPAAKALLSGPTGMAIDSAGNLYFADTGNNRIRMISTSGFISTVAGTGQDGYGGNGLPATQTDLNGPEGIAVDTAGNMYIADTFNNLVRKVTPDGVANILAGNGFPGYSGDNGPAASATLFLPTDVVADRFGNVYIADLGTIRVRLVSQGIISTVAGNSTGSLPLDGESAVTARLKGPTGIALDSSGTLFIAEGSIGSGSGLSLGDYKIWKVTPDGNISTAAGSGQNSFSGDNGPAPRAQMDTPAGMAWDKSGNLYFADSANHRVRKIAPDGSITTVAGIGTPGFAGDGGPAPSAALNSPMGVAVDSQGYLYIADTANNRIRMVDHSGTINTIAGNGNAAYFGDGSLSFIAALHAPRAVAVDQNGIVYIADTMDHRIRRITLDGIIDTYAGRGQGFGGDGGQAAQALLNFPSSLAVDAAGNLYIADQGNNRIRMVSAALGTISTVAGSNGANGLGDGGPAINALLNAPQGVTVDGSGSIYISDAGQNRVRRVGPDGNISTIAGTGRCCYSSDNIPANVAPLNTPWGIAVDANGDVFVADSANYAVRELQPMRPGTFQSVVANGASNLSGPIAPGEVVTVYSSGLGPSQAVQYQPSATGTVGTNLSGVTVLFNGAAAPLLYVSSTQVTAVVPYGLAGTTAQIVASYQGQVTTTTSAPIAASAPALFTVDSTGLGQASATNPDGSSNNVAHPVAAGTILTLYATGDGLTSPAGVDGQLIGTPPPHPSLPVTATIGGLPATVQSAAEATGSIGVLQVQVQVPGGVQRGAAIPVFLQVGDVSSPPGVTIVVN